LTALAGRSTTSPAAMRLTMSRGRRAIGMGRHYRRDSAPGAATDIGGGPPGRAGAAELGGAVAVR
jgi:hypothetical protein